MERETPIEPSHAESSQRIRARVKVIDPITTLGPSVEAELLDISDSDLRLLVPKWIIPGSTLQVLTPKGVVFGKAWFSTRANGGFEVEVSVQQSTADHVC